jgi:hypothetical protein
MPPLLLAAGLTASILLLSALATRNHIEIVRTLSSARIGVVLALFGLALAGQYWRVVPRHEAITLADFLRMGMVWILLAVLYCRLRLHRILTLHLGGTIFFGVFIGLVCSITATIPDNDELMWAGYVGCFLGSLVTVPWAIIILVKEVVH